IDSIYIIVRTNINGISSYESVTDMVNTAKYLVLLKLYLKQLLDVEGKSLSQCFDTDLVIAKNFMTHDDFFQGVRSVLIDKDHTPVYEYNNINDVPEELVNQFFK